MRNTSCSGFALFPDVRFEVGHCRFDSQSTYQSLIEAVRHPNVYGAVIIGLGCEQISGTKMLQDLDGCGKELYFYSIQDFGGPNFVLDQACKKVEELQQSASKQSREPFPLSKLIVSTQCGGSDWTTALTGNVVNGLVTDRFVCNGATVLMSEVGGLPGSEHILAQSAVNCGVAAQIIAMTNARREYFYREHKHTIEEVNPTEGNKAGGITTLVEKSTGNIKKIGSSQICGVLKLFEKPEHYGGVWIVDHHCLGIDAVNATAMALSGAHIQMFTTGRGTPLGNAVMPIVKLTGNPNSYRQFLQMIDFNAGVVMEGAEMDQTGQALFELMLETANGKLTKSEILGNCEFMTLRPAY